MAQTVLFYELDSSLGNALTMRIYMPKPLSITNTVATHREASMMERTHSTRSQKEDAHGTR